MTRRVLPLVLIVSVSAIASCDKKTEPTPVTTTTVATTTVPTAPTITSVTVTFGLTTIETGQSTTATARATYSDGTQSDIAATWSSDNTGVATVDASRTVRAVNPGTATISAVTASGAGGSRLITVIASGPKTQFGAGTHRVNSDIAPGRYFNTPVSGCYWERLKGFGGTLADVIANDFISFSAPQYIVDILGSDLGFDTDSQCGTWFNSPRAPAQTTIRPGVWLVGAQLPAGTYRVTAGAGCYWERLRDFRHELGSIIANDFRSSGGALVVTIAASDVGFSNDGDCGTWTPGSVPTEAGTTQATSQIEQNRDSNRAQNGKSR